MASLVLAASPMRLALMRPSAVLLPSAPTASPLRRPAGLHTRSTALMAVRGSAAPQPQQKAEKSEETAAESSGFMEKALLMAAAMASPALVAPELSWALDGEFGILEGRTAALLHPAVMGLLFFLTLYAGYLGYQWRRVREIGDEISSLKKQLPAEVAEGIPASPIVVRVNELTETRKALVQGGYRDKHFNVGSILLAFGVGIAVEGCVNTYMRTGKLFPGPHLWAGAIIVVLWALAAALVPAMQKGNNNARTAHIALNVANVLLFVSQIPTGLEIVGKVFQFTTWP